MSSSSLWQRLPLTAGDLELSLLPGIGGRVMDVCYRGQSLLFENPDSKEILPDLDALEKVPSRAKHLPFPLWGGEKTWVAPQANWPQEAPHPVLDSGVYSHEFMSSSKVKMVSAVCPLSGLQVTRVVSIGEYGTTWTVEHQLTNRSDASVTTGIWSVMMIERPVSIRFQARAAEEYTAMMGDPALFLSSATQFDEIRCENAQEFKLGVHLMSPRAAVHIPVSGNVIVLETQISELRSADCYAHGHALEVYNSGHYNYAELEWHSPLAELAPGQSVAVSIIHSIREFAS
ncbi:hypothetical protein [Labrenzia sp. PHM005]|uniref:hypothetical protein n=1 Tax=Labrenzia sp. PHM005 TaxID=2590016 RepID=UPI00113FC502|nr:hypothetical protein [Labrenzia sp. PHM005]QDG75392.1 hypothetical protein FJ695_05640 [Labrenzia sp. PHM005]